MTAEPDTPDLLVKLVFSDEARAQTSWHEWAAAFWCDVTFDFFTKAHWLSGDRSVAYFVVPDEAFYRQRVLGLQANRDVKSATIEALN